MDGALERFAGVCDMYYRNVLRYALQRAEPGTAEEVTNETLLIAWIAALTTQDDASAARSALGIVSGLKPPNSG